MGGYNVRLFANLYPREVAGMVLVDSSHPEQEKRFPQALNDMDKTWVREQEFLTFAMPFGIPRMLGFCGSDAKVRAADCNFQSAREGLSGVESFSRKRGRDRHHGFAGRFATGGAVSRSRPARTRYTRRFVKPTNDAWEQMQDEFAQLSTRSTRTIAKNSGHYIQIDRPELVVEAVRKVVEQARQAATQPTAPSNP